MPDPDRKFEVVVALADFVQLLKASRFGAKLGKRNIAREVVELYFDGINLVVTAIEVSRPIPAKGFWEGKVSFPLAILGGLRKAMPTQDPLVISYNNKKLKIGTTSIKSEWAERVMTE